MADDCSHVRDCELCQQDQATIKELRQQVAQVTMERDEALAAMTGDRADITLECAVLRRERDEMKATLTQQVREAEARVWEEAEKLTHPCDCVMRGSYGCRCDALRNEFRRRSRAHQEGKEMADLAQGKMVTGKGHGHEDGDYRI